MVSWVERKKIISYLSKLKNRLPYLSSLHTRCTESFQTGTTNIRSSGYVREKQTRIFTGFLCVKKTKVNVPQ